MAHSEVYGICENKCKVPVLSKDQAYGVTIFEKRAAYGRETHMYGRPNETYVYDGATGLDVYLIGEIEEIIKINPNFNTTLILHNEYGTTSFDSVLSNILRVTYADSVNYRVKFFAPYGFKPQNCTVLHFNLFYDGFNICCNVNGY